jgi:Phage tail tube protein
MSRKNKFRYLAIALKPGAGVYGTDYIAGGETPVAMLTSGCEIKPFVGEELDRDLDDGKTGSSQVLIVGTHVTMTVPLEMAGSGTNTTPVAYSPVLQICGRDENVAVGDVTYSRITDGSEKDATIYFYMDGALHKCTGARGALKLSAKSGEIGKLTAEITALYGGIVSNVFIKPDVSAFVTPEKIGSAPTTFLLDGVAHLLKDIELNDGTEVKYSDNVGGEKVDITDFNPDGSITIEAPGIDVFDPFAIAASHALMPMSFTQGKTAGNIVNATSTAIQFGRPEYTDLDGLIGYKIPFKTINDFVIKSS